MLKAPLVHREFVKLESSHFYKPFQTGFTFEQIKEEAKRIHEKLKHLNYQLNDCMLFAPYTLEINKLKREKNAVVLAHNYQRPEVLYGIADFRGDSLELSRKAAATDAGIILFCGVQFMAETAKILNPEKKVLLPSLEAGCSLSESIGPKDVRVLREQHPDAAVVTYVNTSAAVKAESDACCTSANALKVVKALPNKKIIFLPDEYMAKNIAKLVPEKEIIGYRGRCVVHETFTPDQLQFYKNAYPDVKVLVHTECPPAVVEGADLTGGTSDMLRYVAASDAEKFMVITECGMADLLQAENPTKTFVTPCTLCPYMKKNHLENALEVLAKETNEIFVPEKIRQKALKALQRMFEITG